MMREFKNAKELLALCSEKDLPISEIMPQEKKEKIKEIKKEEEIKAKEKIIEKVLID